jgi:hypothetical protein
MPRTDLTSPAQVREAIKLMNALGCYHTAVVVDDTRFLQMPRHAGMAVDLATEPDDARKPYALLYGAEGTQTCEVAELLAIRKRTDLGTDPETKAHWLVKQAKPEIETVDQFRVFVLSNPDIRQAYNDGLLRALAAK